MKPSTLELICCSNCYATLSIDVEAEGGIVSGGELFCSACSQIDAGALAAGLATPFVLSSLWAFVPIGTMTFLLVIRMALEDKTIHEGLPGYTEYAQETR